MKAYRLTTWLLTCLILVFGLQNCSEKKEEAKEQLVRGLRAYKVAAKAESRIRRFPSILQPADVSVLSFEIAGQLKAINLQAGQKVQLGDLLAEIDPRSLQAQVEQASAGVQQAEAQVANAEGGLPTQARTSEKRRHDAGRVRSVERQSAHCPGATRSSAPSARIGKSQPRSKQASRSLRWHHCPRRGEVVRAGRGRANQS